MQPDPMAIMRSCRGERCDCVPDEVADAVYDALERIPGGDDHSVVREARAELLAPRMAAEGWRFCACYPRLRSGPHARIFDLVHTNLANRLARKAALERAA
jgi:hypothetical protein